MASTSPSRAATRPALGRTLRANLPTAELYEDAIRRGEGLVAAEGPLVVRTGKHTGRSPEDKFIVDEPGPSAKIWWGPVNRPISEANYERLRARLLDYAAEPRPVQPGLPDRRRTGPPAAAARLHRDRLGEHLRPEPVPPALGRAAGRVRAQLHDHQRAVVPGRPGHRGHADRHRDPASTSAAWR